MAEHHSYGGPVVVTRTTPAAATSASVPRNSSVIKGLWDSRLRTQRAASMESVASTSSVVSNNNSSSSNLVTPHRSSVGALHSYKEVTPLSFASAAAAAAATASSSSASTGRRSAAAGGLTDTPAARPPASSSSLLHTLDRRRSNSSAAHVTTTTAAAAAAVASGGSGGQGVSRHMSIVYTPRANGSTAHTSPARDAHDNNSNNNSVQRLRVRGASVKERRLDDMAAAAAAAMSDKGGEDSGAYDDDDDCGGVVQIEQEHKAADDDEDEEQEEQDACAHVMARTRVERGAGRRTTVSSATTTTSSPAHVHMDVNDDMTAHVSVRDRQRHRRRGSVATVAAATSSSSHVPSRNNGNSPLAKVLFRSTLLQEFDADDDAAPLLTVVLDLDETLVSNRNTHGAPATLRPYCLHVLNALRHMRRLELVLWTASTKETALPVVQQLHQTGVIFDDIIFRSAQWFTEPVHTKDLRLLGRDLQRVVMIDNSPNCCKLNAHNCVLVEDFHGYRHDDDAALVNVYYVVEALCKGAAAGVGVRAGLRALAAEGHLCRFVHLPLPESWRCLPLAHIAPLKIPPHGRFVRSNTAPPATSIMKHWKA